MKQEKVLEVAAKLVKAANKSADQYLPGKLAGVVKNHAALAVASALIPIPGADIAAAGANIWTMYIRINKELSVPFSENYLKSIAMGVATNLGAAVAGGLMFGSILKFIPGLGTVGGAAVMGGIIYGVTIASGIVYMKALTRILGSSSTSFSESDLKNAVDQEMRSKGELKDIINEYKKSYKK